MKSFFKKILVVILGHQVRRLRRKHVFKIIGVAGSIGKTSTKLAIAKLLEGIKKIRYQEGNYNEIVSVPLIFFGHSMPSLWNIFEWIKIIIQNEIQIYSDFPFEMVIIELGTDAPGQILEFRKYLKLDLAVLTAVAPEHMEFFGTIESVAEEEWSVGYFSDKILANRDLCKITGKGLDNKKITYYGTGIGSEYKIIGEKDGESTLNFEIFESGKKIVQGKKSGISGAELYSVCAAVATARIFGIQIDKIGKLVNRIKSFSGRMQVLEGVNDFLIIDDSYNASPDAVIMALNTLAEFRDRQRVAILGMMNELGNSSEEEHRKIGKHCTPKNIDLLIVVGEDAKAYTAPEARKNGCNVYEALNALDAGRHVLSNAEKGAAILGKGSQNKVFVEEALKLLLRDKSDARLLVRQDTDWLSKKSLFFGQKIK
jgi:UDP-N-acetylmuramoyl-tripeptide--D-alanyl-D-alanine ligase